MDNNTNFEKKEPATAVVQFKAGDEVTYQGRLGTFVEYISDSYVIVRFQSKYGKDEEFSLPIELVKAKVKWQPLDPDEGKSFNIAAILKKYPNFKKVYSTIERDYIEIDEVNDDYIFAHNKKGDKLQYNKFGHKICRNPSYPDAFIVSDLLDIFPNQYMTLWNMFDFENASEEHNLTNYKQYIKYGITCTVYSPIFYEGVIAETNEEYVYVTDKKNRRHKFDYFCRYYGTGDGTEPVSDVVLLFPNKTCHTNCVEDFDYRTFWIDWMEQNIHRVKPGEDFYYINSFLEIESKVETFDSECNKLSAKKNYFLDIFSAQKTVDKLKTIFV